MARSHVKELLRKAFGFQQVLVDEDGDVPMPCGTAMVYASVVGRGRLVRVWSRAAAGVKPTKAVLREVNDANAHAGVVRVYAQSGAVWVEGHPVEGLRVKDLTQLCKEVGDLSRPPRAAAHRGPWRHRDVPRGGGRRQRGRVLSRRRV